MCDKISAALAAQALAALSINDYRGAWRLAEELKRRWSMEPDTQGFNHNSSNNSDNGNPSKNLRLEVLQYR